MSDDIFPKGYITRGDIEWVIVCGKCDKWDVQLQPRKVLAISKFVADGWRHNDDGKWTCQNCLKEVKHE